MPRAVLAAVSLALLGFAQTPTTSPAVEEAKKTATLRGKVVHAVTGEPVRKARVMLARPDSRAMPREIAVDASGVFEFSGLQPGRYSLSASRNGFVTQVFGARKTGTRFGAGTILTLAPGQEMRDLAISLVPQAVIMGRVIDEDGDPMVGIHVSASVPLWQRGKRILAPMGNASTNDLGEYRMFGLAPGAYLLRAGRFQQMVSRTRSEEPAAGKAERNYVPTYHPGVLDAASSPRILVKAGAEIRGVDVRMVQAVVVRVRGRLLDAATGKPIRGNVMAFPRERSGPGWLEIRHALAGSPAEGWELTDMPAGQYRLIATSNVEQTQLSASLDLDVGDTHIEGVELRLAPGVAISGKITYDGPPPKDGNLQVGLQPSDDMSDMGYGGGGAEVREDGTFTIPGVAAGRYRVSVYHPEYYLKAGRAGDQDLLEVPLDVTGGPRSDLELTVSDKGGEATGSVKDKDGKPAHGVVVMLIPNDESKRSDYAWMKQATTDQYGVYRMKLIRPGAYRLFAFDGFDGLEYMDPEFLARIEKRGARVDMEEKAVQTVDLEVIAPDDRERER